MYTEGDLYKLASYAHIRADGRAFKAARLVLLDGLSRTEACNKAHCTTGNLSVILQRLRAAEIRIEIESKIESKK